MTGSTHKAGTMTDAQGANVAVWFRGLGIFTNGVDVNGMDGKQGCLPSVCVCGKTPAVERRGYFQVRATGFCGAAKSAVSKSWKPILSLREGTTTEQVT